MPIAMTGWERLVRSPRSNASFTSRALANLTEIF